MRLSRPYIPLSVRVQVARRQALDAGLLQLVSLPDRPLSRRLEILIRHLFGDTKVHLDHDPALAARAKIRRNGAVVRYVPGANDPDFLVYRVAAAHRIKTNIRGEHGQHPDRVLIKRQRRLEKKLKKNRRIRRSIPARKNPWPKGRSLTTKERT